ncbi:MAG: hypothetical protein QNL07_04215 [Candidatus Planktophila sp.]|jgi:outer membrane protein W|tara:strand:- start:4285 stop:4767 length:483 start_codon:yes stop_codon:yes gene_type:complete
MKKIVIGVLVLLFFSSSPATLALSQGTFYLELKPGCYAANEKAQLRSKWSDTDYKTLYQSSCTSSHHYEVFYTGKLKAKKLTSKAAKSEAGETCDVAALNILSGQQDLPLTLTYGYFFPDPGAEVKRYGKKIICFFHVIDPKNKKFSLSVSRTFRDTSYI